MIYLVFLNNKQERDNMNAEVNDVIETRPQALKDEYTYLYIGDRSGGGKHTGIMTIAVKRLSDVQYKIGVSFCSPRDAFNKKLGRLIARGRCDTRKDDLVNGYTCICTQSHTSIHDTIHHWLRRNAYNSRLPRWTRRLLQDVYIQ